MAPQDPAILFILFILFEHSWAGISQNHEKSWKLRWGNHSIFINSVRKPYEKVEIYDNLKKSVENLVEN